MTIQNVVKRLEAEMEIWGSEPQVPPKSKNGSQQLMMLGLDPKMAGATLIALVLLLLREVWVMMKAKLSGS